MRNFYSSDNTDIFSFLNIGEAFGGEDYSIEMKKDGLSQDSKKLMEDLSFLEIDYKNAVNNILNDLKENKK